MSAVNVRQTAQSVAPQRPLPWWSLLLLMILGGIALTTLAQIQVKVTGASFPSRGQLSGNIEGYAGERQTTIRWVTYPDTGECQVFFQEDLFTDGVWKTRHTFDDPKVYEPCSLELIEDLFDLLAHGENPPLQEFLNGFRNLVYALRSKYLVR